MSGLKVSNAQQLKHPRRKRVIPTPQTFVWDGVDEDERPATREEMQAGVAMAKRRGRPAGTANKVQVALRVDPEVLAAFRAGGPGWQTRMNAVLRDWVRDHPTG